MQTLVWNRKKKIKELPHILYHQWCDSSAHWHRAVMNNSKSREKKGLSDSRPGRQHSSGHPAPICDGLAGWRAVMHEAMAHDPAKQCIAHATGPVPPLEASV